MKKLLLALFLIPCIAFGQRTNTFLKLTNTAGAMIKGTSTAIKFERSIEANPFQSNSSANDTRISFSMPASSASGELRAQINNKQPLPKGEVFVMTRDTERMLMVYKINMEKITVESCNDVTDPNGNMVTQVVLKAARIGWTYYADNKRTGVQTVSSKNGWNAETNSPWTGF